MNRCVASHCLRASLQLAKWVWQARCAPRGQERLEEAAKLGFTVAAVVPKANVPKNLNHKDLRA